ncbi:MAG: hypothetical protein KKE44_19505 [Proteobacteria bacterium]|nr:hypothetical protein [Pseudomonadota bacterium]MBU1584921.1 hypothetical protein [Pseudomonadota bacterium]MBU2453785.1 hypothetical protein [Pseudomonadota bacterium]MBU2630461.1 hypothetical protein [Pseudomonadota bacterium]
MEEKENLKLDLTIEKLISLGQYAIDALEHPDNEIEIRPDMLNALKGQVTLTRRFTGKIPQDDEELNKLVFYFTHQKEIVDEVVQRPHLKQDIEFTAKFIMSNQKRVNEILNRP